MTKFAYYFDWGKNFSSDDTGKMMVHSIADTEANHGVNSVNRTTVQPLCFDLNERPRRSVRTKNDEILDTADCSPLRHTHKQIDRHTQKQMVRCA